MTIRFNPRWLLVPALMFSLQFCRAQIDVPPSISFNLGDSNSPDAQLWDLGGSYRLDLTVMNNGFATPVGLSFILIQDGKGNLSSPTNDNTEEMDVTDNGVFTVTPTVKGKVTGSGGLARVHLTIHVRGSGTLANHNVNSFNASLTVDAETDPSSGDLLGTKKSKFAANFPGLTSIRGQADFSTPMPQGANATWNLTLQLAALKKVLGTAIVTTPSRAIGLNVSGELKKGVVKLTAKGSDTVPNTTGGVGAGAAMQLPPTFDSIVFKGHLLGQKLVFGFPEGD